MTCHTRVQSISAVQYLHVIVALHCRHTMVVGSRRERLFLQQKSNQQRWRTHVVLHPKINQNNHRWL